MSARPTYFSPADGEEWTLAIFGDSSWFTDGSVIPDELPASFVSLLVGIDFDAAGKEVGFAFATIDTFSTNLLQAEAIGISAPATAGLAGLARLFLNAAAGNTATEKRHPRFCLLEFQLQFLFPRPCARGPTLNEGAVDKWPSAQGRGDSQRVASNPYRHPLHRRHSVVSD